ncbi:hypothetical protein C2G38_2158718 [Gigaspora rosea]|uniref:Uncharacterized protein n=1 Tax=Gigaspora rosea TaxID=44941 RepID=A0A397W495_9GLOM|nr:hypothetical protein C2G38_2158718 [Gigaspora rosea]
MATDFQVERLKSSMDPPVTTLQLLDQTLLQEDPYPRVNSSDLTYLEWLRAFVDYDEIEGPRQEDGHMVEACQLEDPYDDKVDWEEYYWEELENLYHDPDTGIMWTLCDTSPEVMNLEEIYMVNDHWEIEAEERFLTATTDHITNGNGWYEEEDFKPEEPQQEGGAGYLIEEASRPEYNEVPEDLAVEANWDDDEKLEKNR